MEMPDFSDTIEAEARACCQYYTGNKTYNGSSLNLDNPIYVDGNLTVHGSSFRGCGMMVATGDITISGSSAYLTSDTSVGFYSVNGDIKISGSSCRVHGLVYAPNGSVTFNGSSQAVYGRIVADKIKIDGSSAYIYPGTHDLDCLPSEEVIRLVE